MSETRVDVPSTEDTDKIYFVIKIDNPKMVTEKMVLNLLTKIKDVTPIETRVLQVSKVGKTVIFLLYEEEKDAEETVKRLENQVLVKRPFKKNLLKAKENEIPSDVESLTREVMNPRKLTVTILREKSQRQVPEEK